MWDEYPGIFQVMKEYKKYAMIWYSYLMVNKQWSEGNLMVFVSNKNS